MDTSSISKTTVDVLNKQIADWNILFVKLHNYHWYVKGPNFFTLHTKFEEFYNEASLHIDELAERVLIIGGKPLATMREYLDTSSLNEANKNITSDEMVQDITKDYNYLIEELKDGMEIAESENDSVTHDLLLAIREQLAKHVWMLTAYLN
ncbi:DNA starvation/stationary phase protection protein [Bacillus sp. AFS077874]|uniref:Dps family protein n=1 Tax=unclassified Bacillus (in: firmicutes) TaxID=185979 RepID=UPI000BEC6170|nr:MULTISPECIES: Dps family protein [unclassified Bacillus (in: firmicutes)]PEC51910.1 DNA starvation/stationary phase protection protein [Bacillus sp. AFS096315]PFM79007.1 DNA starvation/stationary phase protection protein [Bacillus sp. AFS077874]